MHIHFIFLGRAVEVYEVRVQVLRRGQLPADPVLVLHRAHAVVEVIYDRDGAERVVLVRAARHQDRRASRKELLAHERLLRVVPDVEEVVTSPQQVSDIGRGPHYVEVQFRSEHKHAASRLSPECLVIVIHGGSGLTKEPRPQLLVVVPVISSICQVNVAI
jgi:hypothetical protein